MGAAPTVKLLPKDSTIMDVQIPAQGLTMVAVPTEKPQLKAHSTKVARVYTQNTVAVLMAKQRLEVLIKKAVTTADIGSKDRYCYVSDRKKNVSLLLPLTDSDAAQMVLQKRSAPIVPGAMKKCELLQVILVLQAALSLLTKSVSFFKFCYTNFLSISLSLYLQLLALCQKAKVRFAPITPSCGTTMPRKAVAVNFGTAVVQEMITVSPVKLNVEILA